MYRLVEQIRKQNLHICCLQETDFRSKGTQTEIEAMEKDTAWNVNQKKAEVSTLLSDKIDFKTKTVTWDKEEHNVMTKGLIKKIQQLQIYIPLNAGILKGINWIETNIKEKNWSKTMLLGELTYHINQWKDNTDRKSIKKHWQKPAH